MNTIATVSSNLLPDPNQFNASIYDMAWPQVLALSSAMIGLIIVGTIISVFRG
ncbi:hypothetical protein [Spirulina sp. 06S082]|uniref:hypothetical protein n=1 Tax=Spirulina sp. 06S082 TaxID=3110248 RepID=UPI002B1FB953|nr:hypothetical protein [Spirulina sp. 06S082]MEA5472159.1 hypothetical protein [Spirulina sp. 06S082]